jgi:hypothetical protein
MPHVFGLTYFKRQTSNWKKGRHCHSTRDGRPQAQRSAAATHGARSRHVSWSGPDQGLQSVLQSGREAGTFVTRPRHPRRFRHPRPYPTCHYSSAHSVAVDVPSQSSLSRLGESHGQFHVGGLPYSSILRSINCAGSELKFGPFGLYCH